MTAAAGPQLYVVYLGGDPTPGRISEDHEVVVVVADGPKAARAAARAKWGGTTRPHVDAIRPVTVIDGYAVRLEPTSAPDADAVDLTFDPEDD